MAGCKLTKDKPEQMWAPAKKEEEEEEEEDDDFVQETLFLKHVSRRNRHVRTDGTCNQAC